MDSLFRRQDPDPQLCEKYAGFASHMVRWQFKIIYWTLFVSNLLVLFIASWTYIRGQAAIEKFAHNPRVRTKRIRQSVFMCLGCVCVSTVIVIMEAYSILALQFCDGEDLISLYWSTWTMIQIGSLIAMIGIILAMAHVLRDRKHPPWGLALGTPVLVIAGFLHLFHDFIKKRIRRNSRRRNAFDDSMGPPMSQANTISVNPDEEEDIEYMAQVIGLTFDGGPIIRYTDAVPETLPEHAELLGYCAKQKPIVMCKRESVQFLMDSPAQLPRAASPSYRKGT